MKGFLQRIAAAAIRPEPRLKPLVGSIYAGEPVMDFTEEKPWLPLAPPRPILQASLQAAPEQTETRIVHAHEPSPRRLASVVSELTLRKQTVLAPTTYAAEHSSSNATVAAASASTSLSAQHSGRTEEHPQTRATTPSASSAPQQSERRLVPFMPILTHRELPQPAPSGAKKPIPQLTPREKPTPASTGGEIQINIGRIEVIAVPPPGTAAPATSRSRATSLDDYLKSRSGRPG
jgi:hypothetical protein